MLLLPGSKPFEMVITDDNDTTFVFNQLKIQFEGDVVSAILNGDEQSSLIVSINPPNVKFVNPKFTIKDKAKLNAIIKEVRMLIKYQETSISLI